MNKKYMKFETVTEETLIYLEKNRLEENNSTLVQVHLNLFV